MFSLELAQLPSFMNNTAQGVLKRLSTAVGYNMTCDSQEKVEKQLPEYDYDPLKQEFTKPVQKRQIFENSSELVISQGIIEEKPIATAEAPLKSRRRGKVRVRDEFLATQNPSQLKQHRREVLRKIREGETRRSPWRPDQVLKNRWIKMSRKERDEMVEKMERLISIGTTKTCDWLTWNVPKITIKVLYMILAGEVPEYADDAMKMCDLIRDMEKM